MFASFRVIKKQHAFIETIIIFNLITFELFKFYLKKLIDNSEAWSNIILKLEKYIFISKRKNLEN